MKEGFSVNRYHAGLSDEERRKNQDDFIYDRVQVICATSAFGMGYNKDYYKNDGYSYYQD